MQEPLFQGVIGRTFDESTPWWPQEPRPAAGTPNVVVVVFDDVGFAHFNSYGSTIGTPNLNRLADGGLRFVNFHTTALCSPTRACMLTGRNHHAVGMRAISNFDTGFPNMRGAIPHSAQTLAEILREQGFGTYMVGKWHVTPLTEAGARTLETQRGQVRIFKSLDAVAALARDVGAKRFQVNVSGWAESGLDVTTLTREGV